MKSYFYIEITDTYAGDANYSWVTRHIIHATTIRGAINKLSRMSGINWHCVDKYNDCVRYDSKSGAVCCFIEQLSDDMHGYLQTVSQSYLSTDERAA